ncbi:MAG: hypothetical protein K1X75_12060 [Leptospirales bacterium]|nr:hypothetical protein [Leptospirales bacterium]
MNACAASDRLPALLPSGGGAQAFSIDYAGPLPELDSISINPACQTESIVAFGDAPGQPSLQFHDGELCVESQRRGWFDLERGLRWRLRLSDLSDANALQLQLLFASEPSAFSPRILGQGWEAGEYSSSELRSQLGDLIAVADGRRALLNDFQPAQLYLSYAAADPESLHFLARRFARAEFLILAGTTDLALVYPRAEQRQRLVGWILHNPAVAQAAAAALQGAPARNSALLAAAASNLAHVSELRFASQSDGPLLEISSEDRDTRFDQLLILDDGAYQLRISRFLFSHSAELVDDVYSDFRLSRNAALPSLGFQFDSAAARVVGCSAQRSCLRLTASESFQPALRAVGDRFPGNPGINAALLDTETAAASPFDCGLDDVLLSEWNPLALRRSGMSGDAGGKFIELKYLRVCNPRRLLLRAGLRLFSLQGARLGDRELLAAAQAPFLQEATIDSRLRSLNWQEPLALVDLAGQREKALFVPDASQWLGGADAQTLGLRSLHSLCPCVCGLCAHGLQSLGLRPDYANEQAMSPGFASDSEQAAPESCRLPLAIREILPQGSRLDDGSLRAADEFVEIAFAAAIEERAARPLLQLLILSGEQLVNGYLLPAPGAIELFAVGRGVPACFAPDQWLSAPNLRLPDGAADYELRMGESVERVQLNSADYLTLVGDGLRRSWARFDAIPGERWAAHGASPHSACGRYTQASAGFANQAAGTLP